MGYLTFDIKQREDIKTFKFFYGTYDNGTWKAKLVDDETTYAMEFCYQTMAECFSELSHLLAGYGKIQRIKARISEKPFIEGFEQNVNQHFIS